MPEPHPPRTMRRKLAWSHLSFILGLLAFALAPEVSYAKKSSLTPAKVKQVKQTRKSYDTCRKDALRALKQGKASRSRFEVLLSACKENFPGADLYVSCKRQAVQTDGPKSSKLVQDCRRLLFATEFDPTSPLPFFAQDDQLFFAGIGLNRTLPAQTLAPPNFTCEKVGDLVRSPEHAQYLLFGNHPNLFAGLQEVKGDALLRALKLTKPQVEGVDTPAFGRVYHDPRQSKSTVFFPAANCDFDAEPGKIFAGLSAYYLLDAAASSVTPFFGIAYYREGQKAVTTAKLTQALIKALGGKMRRFPKNDQVTFIAAAPLSEMDEEGDPKNLCHSPRDHQILGVVQSRKDEPNEPQYVVVANIKNLCEFGDQLSKRLVE